MAKPLAPPNTASEMALLADRCVQCGLCLPHCPTYQLDRSEPESPRGRIAYMKALALGQINATQAGDLHLDHCLGCLRCESVCPANVEYGELLGFAREQQFLRERPAYRQKIMSDLLGRPSLLNLAGILGRAMGHLPGLPEKVSPPDQPMSGAEKKVAIFNGCIANGYEAATRHNLQKLLNALGFHVEPVTGQTCCGTAAHHMGDTRTAKKMAETNLAAFNSNIPVLCLATGCHQQLSLSLQSHNKVIDALDFIFQHAGKLEFKSAKRKISLHIPCSQSTMVKSDYSTRKLLAMIPDLEIYELPDKGCCGAAGLHMLAEPVRADQLRLPLIEEIHASQATELLSSNIGCRLHISNGIKIPVRHPIDFLAEHLA